MEQNILYLIGGGIGGALITSIIGPYVIQSKERRAARAEVLKTLMAVEKAHWKSANYSTLQSKINELKAAALIAGADRKLIDYYARVTKATYSSGQEEILDDGEEVWMFPIIMTTFNNDVIENLANTIWHPVKTFPLRRLILQKLQKKELTIMKQLADEKIQVNWG